jgi:hypothetical protein
MNEPTTDTPCPHCKGVHFSFWNVQRCATRHRIVNELANYQEEQRQHFAPEDPVETAEEKHARQLAAWIAKRESRKPKSYGK